VKNILNFKLFEQVYLNDINPFSKEKKHVRGLRFVNKEEALRSVRRMQEMIDKKQIEIKDAIIASFIMSERSKNHKFINPGIKEGGIVWENFLNNLRKKQELLDKSN
jgi:hypothetical protein